MPIVIEKPEQVSATIVVSAEPVQSNVKQSSTNSNDWVFYVVFALLLYFLFRQSGGVLFWLLKIGVIGSLLFATLILFVLTG